jgi:hypothetical protein
MDTLPNPCFLLTSIVLLRRGTQLLLANPQVCHRPREAETGRPHGRQLDREPGDTAASKAVAKRLGCSLVDAAQGRTLPRTVYLGRALLSWFCLSG